MKTKRALAWLLAGAAGMLFGCRSPEEPASPSSQAAVAATAAEHAHDAPTPTPAAEAAPKVPVLEQDLAYGEGAKSNLVGYLAMPQDAAEPLPGIIVIHEWWGLNDNIKAMTRRLAGEGYVALAVDLYGGATASTPDAAQALMAALLAEPEAATRNLSQAYDYLEKYALAPRIASIGWCLGGGWSLQTALLYPETLDAMVMYYGQVTTDRQRLATLNVPVLGFFGGEDQSIPVREVLQFRTTLNELGKNAEVLVVPRADHAFANPSGGNYNAQAADEAWDTTLKFLERHLKLSTPTQQQ
ncbi:MAG TPA: dienelactone hydrolase family protein [Gammaproteobacteria bacterium]|nr:dienelactone hydrolase family protein [Gammaproteobacteria bacterium]